MSSDRYADTAADTVKLDPDHPGFRDPVYRERRNTIAHLALGYLPPAEVPVVEYTGDEHGVWKKVWTHLAPLHESYACSEYRACSAELRIARDAIPQLREVNQQLKKSSGFQMTPVSGLVSSRSFLGELGKNHFLSTQYMRHHSRPLYTPEPDVIHELVGHAATLTHPEFAKLNRAFGTAADRASEEALALIERVYWYTLEFGLVQEKGGIKAYGAGLLSSFGELGRFEKQAKLVPLDISQMIQTPYDPTQYQDKLYVATSFEAAARQVTRWLDEVAPPRSVQPA